MRDLKRRNDGGEKTVNSAVSGGCGVCDRVHSGANNEIVGLGITNSVWDTSGEYGGQWVWK